MRTQAHAEEELAKYFGGKIKCRPFARSSSGGIYDVSHESSRLVVKLFEEGDYIVAARTVLVLSELERIDFDAPRLLEKSVITVGPYCGYAYHYIEGTCLADRIQSPLAHRAIAHLIGSVSASLAECWEDKRWPSDLFRTFNLTSKLKRGLCFLETVSTDLHSQSRQRLAKEWTAASPTHFRPLHADLHMGNVLRNERGLVPIDFDSMCLAMPEKAFASFIGKIYERTSPESSRRSLVADIIAAGGSQGVSLDGEVLRLCVLEKKLGELQYLDRLSAGTGAPVAQVLAYRRAAFRGLATLLREWDWFPV